VDFPSIYPPQTRRNRHGGDGSAADGLSRSDAESVRRIIPEDGSEAAGGLQPESSDHGDQLGEIPAPNSSRIPTTFPTFSS
jgi:hypothetical protein